MNAVLRYNHVRARVRATYLLGCVRVGQRGVLEDGHDEDDRRLQQVEVSSGAGEVQEIAETEQLRITN